MGATRLDGRRVIVTGAAGGQGVAVARRLVEEGARVALSDLPGERLDAIATELGAVACPADVTDEDGVARAVELAVAGLGGLDGLYNNAGVLHELDAPVDHLERDVWDRVIAINATGVFLFCKHAVPALLREPSSVIVNVSSTAAHAGDTACHAYAASKGALISLTRSIAQRWGPDGLRAVTLCPGFVETAMVGFVLDDESTAGAVRAATALRRFGHPSEIAAAAAFLLSEDASFVTGCALDIHGGLVK